MSITINGTGSITGLTAGGLPDGSVTNADLEYAGTSGQVLTSQGSGSAPQWATVTDTGATWTTLSSQSLASSAEVVVSGIPSTATHVRVSFTNLKKATNTEWGIRVGGSGGLQTSGYDTIGGYWGNSSSGSQYNDRWACKGSASTGFDWNGQIDVFKMSGNLWQGFAWFHYNGGGTSRFAHGEVSLSATLDRIGFTGQGGNFASGIIYPSYMEP